MKLSSLHQVRGTVGTWLLPSLFAVALVGCGGGGSSSPFPPQAPIAVPPPPTGDLRVVVTDTAQKPLEGAAVAVNGCFNARRALTGTDGAVLFTAVPTCAFGGNPGSISVNVHSAGYFSAWRPTMRLEAGKLVEERLALEHGSALAVGVLGTRAVERVDGGRKLLVEARLAVVGPDGKLRPGLDESSFFVPYYECGWGDCGVWLPDGSSGFGLRDAKAEPGSVTSVAGGATRSSYAAGLLLDESKSMAQFDTSAVRRTGSKRFLAAVSAPDSVAVAVSRGDLAPSLTVVGGYTADGANHLAAIDQLTSGDGESNLLPALSAFVDYTAVSAPAAVRRSIVALGLGYWDSGCATTRSAQCTTARDTAARAAASGLDIVTIGQWHHMAEMAARSRGAFFWLGHAAQIETTLNAVDSALAGTLDHYTVRLLIDLGGTVATSGTVLFHYITVRASATAELMVPLVVVVD